MFLDLLVLVSPPVLGDPTADIGAAEGAVPGPTATPAANSAASSVPWGVLKERRLIVTSNDGSTVEGTFLGLEDDRAILETDDGTFVGIELSAVASARTVKPPPPPVPALAVPPEGFSLTFREQEELSERKQTRRSIGVAHRAAIAGGIVASLSAVASIAAEAVNINRWRLSKQFCGEDDYTGEERCGWTESGSYSYADSAVGIAAATGIALPLHVAGGATVLAPTALLRKRMGDREGRGRQIAAWTLWGAGIGALAASQAISWTQLVNAQYVCEPGTSNRNCRSITDTRGAPPGFFLLTAGLTLASTAIGIIDTNKTTERASRSLSSRTAERSHSVSVFPVRLRGGGGLGLSGRF